MISGLEIFRRCGELNRIADAARNKSMLVRMQYLRTEGGDAYQFQALNRRQVLLLSRSEKARLENTRPTVLRVITRFQRELEALAYANGLERHLWGRGFGRDRSTYRTYRPTPAVGFTPSNERVVFDTFDDGRSVWTVPCKVRGRPVP